MTASRNARRRFTRRIASSSPTFLGPECRSRYFSTRYEVLAVVVPGIRYSRLRSPASPYLFYKMGLNPPPSLGTLELAALLAVVRLGDDAYGLAVRRDLAERMGRELSVGA